MANGFKTGGRQKGSTNKRKVIGTAIQKLVEEELEKLPIYLQSLNNKEKTEFLLKLMPYVVPKYTHQKVEVEVEDDTPLFSDIQIVTTTNERERLEKVRAYEEKHNVKIL